MLIEFHYRDNVDDLIQFKLYSAKLISIATSHLPLFIDKLPAKFKCRPSSGPFTKPHQNLYYCEISRQIYLPGDYSKRTLISCTNGCSIVKGSSVPFTNRLYRLFGGSKFFTNNDEGKLTIPIDPTHDKSLKRICIDQRVLPENGNLHTHTYYHHSIPLNTGVIIYFATIDQGERDCKDGKFSEPYNLYAYYALYIHKPKTGVAIKYAIMTCLGSNYDDHNKAGTAENQLFRLIPYNFCGLKANIISQLGKEQGKSDQGDNGSIRVRIPEPDFAVITVIKR